MLQATGYEQKLDGNRLRGVPVSNAGEFLADRRWNHNEPTDFLDLESNVVQAKFSASAFDGLTYDLGLRYTDGTEIQDYHEPNGLFDSNGDGVSDTSRRQFRDQYRRNELVSFGTNAIRSGSVAGLDSRVLLGGDRYRANTDFTGLVVNGDNRPSAKDPAFRAEGDSGRVIGRIDPRTLSAHQRLSEAADPLHFGTFGGYWTKTIWFVFGAGLTAMAVTGVVIYALRISRLQEGGAAGAKGPLRLVWQAMGRARWIVLALCLLPLGLAPFVFL